MRRRFLAPVTAVLALNALLCGCNVYDASLIALGSAVRDAGRDPTDVYIVLCGNGVVDANERCDLGIAAGDEGACPSQCASKDPCHPSQRVEDGCQTECFELEITRALTGDDCCPEGIGADQDGDCGTCGDKIVGPSESCDPPQNCPSQAACKPRNTCLRGVFTGAAETCTARCNLVEITSCEGGDQCCPAGCSSASDSDCSATCGNGVVEDDAGETCEIGDPTRPCADDCDDHDVCTSDVKTGSAKNCNVVCSHIPIVSPAHGDGCCPPGENQVNDSDCSPVCGNEVVESGEQCDPCPANCNDNSACTIDSSIGSAGACTLMCNHATISTAHSGDGCCPSGANANTDSDCNAVCGNGVREGAEVCDPCPANCSDGNACTTDSASGSAAACTLSCSHTAITTAIAGDGCCPGSANYNTDSDCPAVCGNNVREGAEKCDPCAANCNDGNVCTTDTTSGSPSACSLVCTHTPITAASSGDGCCPSGANANTDSDCSPVCGNTVVEAGEDCDGQAYCNGTCDQVLQPSIVHRYRFNGSGTSVTDSVGTAHGTVVGATLSGSGSVVLGGGTSGPYVNLPNRTLSTLTNATVEIWFTWGGGIAFQRAFDFGYNSNGEDQQGLATTTWFFTPVTTLGTARMLINFTAAADDYANDFAIDHASALSSNVQHQVVGVFDDANDTLRLYVDGALSGSRTGVTGHLSSIDDRNVWIGRSNYNDAELGGTVHEFRIYNTALSAAQVTASYNAGPDP